MSSLSYTRRAVPWPSVAVAAVPTLALGSLAVVYRDDAWATSVMHAALLLLALPAAFIFDEPSAPVVAASPRSPWWCHLRRLAGLVPLLVLASLGVWAWSQLVTVPQANVLLLTVVAAILIAAAVGAASRAAGRFTPGEAVAAGAGIAVAGLMLFDPRVRSVQLLPSAGDASAAEVWLCCVVMGVALAVLALAPLRLPGGAVDV